MVRLPRLRARLKSAGAGFVDGSFNLLGYVAGLAAYKEGDAWLKHLLRYLQANRDLVVSFVRDNLPGIDTFEPQGTYLVWLDCREAGMGDVPADFFLKEAEVALFRGDLFGEEGKGFARLNFGCPRALLEEALERMKKALDRFTR